ncbi:oxidase [Caballeronia calidae]|uniref:Oxidase n=1 Tax=Caballeronia calidae TaxID=1777139 RepID=A0A158ECY2_9BURK|nr:RICIN domain-containing protein [Caballeronia calidae]SAL04580.1 oxidase [Caballeronia calidae]
MPGIRSTGHASSLLFRCMRFLLLIAMPLAWAGVSPAAHAQTSAPITLNGTGMCADVSGESRTPGAPVISWSCWGGANQQWLPAATGARYTLINQNSGLCMDVSGISPDPGGPIIQWTCNGGLNQAFSLIPQGGGYAIVAGHSGLCVSASNTTSQGVQLTQQVCNGSATQTWQVSGLPAPKAALPSQWSEPVTLPLVPLQAANLPNGTVLVWAADSALDFTPNNPPGQTYTAIFNPSTGRSRQSIVTYTGHDMFCPGIANLPDGRIFVTGGSSARQTSIYSPSTSTWTASDQLKIPRGYQGSVTLSNGNVFLVGGSWSGGLGGKSGETWTPGSGWQINGAITDDYIVTNDNAGWFRADNHAWLFAVGNGRVFHAGPSRAMHWFDTAGNGNVTSAGNRGSDGNAMNGNAVMYDVGKILAVGGAPSYDQSQATSNATLIDISSGTARTQTIAPMSYRRAFSNSVVLPNGQVVVVGGQTFAAPFSDDNAVLTPELWDPQTNAFSPLAPQAIPRTYHSVALLLNDGRVLSGGGGLCGGCATNHTDVEILTPPYLLNSDGSAASRPSLTSVPTDAQLGTTIVVTGSRNVRAFVLMRSSSVTHSLNNEQRRVPLSFTVGTAGEYQLNIPSDPGVVIPGYYMLFALNGRGVPSVSRVLLVH